MTALVKIIEATSEVDARLMDPFNTAREHRNFVTNERGTQVFLPAMTRAGRGRAYVGIGPEQNYTYIAAIAPSIAFIIDVQRNNMLVHLMYKWLCELSANRAEYVSKLFGRDVSNRSTGEVGVRELFGMLRNAPMAPALQERTAAELLARVRQTHGNYLSSSDGEQIRWLYAQFVTYGPDIRRDPQGAPWVPSYAEVMQETNEEGVCRSYLASERAFQCIRRYHRENRIVPVVGSVAGTTAMRGIAKYIRDHDGEVGSVYLSNVEQYVSDVDRRRFIRNIDGLPRSALCTVLRTKFERLGDVQGRSNYRQATICEPITKFVEREAGARK